MSDGTLNDFMRWDFGPSRPWRLKHEEIDFLLIGSVSDGDADMHDVLTGGVFY